MQKFIEQLFGGSEFVQQNWPSLPAQTHGELSRLPEALRTLTLDSVLECYEKSYIDSSPYRELIQVLFPADRQKYGWHMLGRKEMMMVDSTAARLLYERQGCDLAIQLVDSFMPEIAKLCRILEAELVLPNGSVTCIAFASPEASGIHTHFDREEVISVQLVGNKEWFIAPNESIVNPSVRYMVSEPPQLSNRHRVQLGENTFPSEMPADVKKLCHMKPGSAMFLPRGWWHSTKPSNSDVFSLTFGMETPTMMDLLISTLKEYSDQDSDWRLPVVGTPDRNSIPAIKNKLKSMLDTSSLDKILENLRLDHS